MEHVLLQPPALKSGTPLPEELRGIWDLPYLKGLFSDKNEKNGQLRLQGLYTQEPEVIAWRHGVFADLIANKPLADFFEKSLQQLQDFEGFAAYMPNPKEVDTMQQLICLREMRFALDFLQQLDRLLSSPATRFSSQGLGGLRDRVRAFCAANQTKELSQRVREFSDRVGQPKSLTLAVNLDDSLNPFEIGILSVNDRYYSSGNFIDRCMQGTLFDKEGFEVIAPLVPAGFRATSQGDRTQYASVLSAINRACRRSLRGLRAILRDFVKQILQVLPVFEEALYYGCGLCIRSQAGAKGRKTCFAAPSQSESARLDGLYDLELLLAAPGTYTAVAEPAQTPAVQQEQASDHRVLGFTASLQAQLLYQLGLPVPAERAALAIRRNDEWMPVLLSQE